MTLSPVRSVVRCKLCGNEEELYCFSNAFSERWICQRCEEIQRQNQETVRKHQYLQKKIPPRFFYADWEQTKIPESRIKSDVILFAGGVGTGKTSAAYAVAKRLFLSHKIRHFCIIRCFRLLSEIKGSFSDHSFEKILKKYTETDLLFIDEWDKVPGTAFEESVLFELILERYQWQKKTGIIINVPDEKALWNRLRPELLDRFRKGLVFFRGDSRR